MSNILFLICVAVLEGTNSKDRKHLTVRPRVISQVRSPKAQPLEGGLSFSRVRFRLREMGALGIRRGDRPKSLLLESPAEHEG